MAMFSRFFVLGPRGDTLIVKEYQGHISPKTATPQDFWSRVQENSELSPVIDINGVHCISQLQDGLFFVLTSVDNISPSLGFEMLGRIVKVLKDYCGVLDEETLRLNFILVYELLDEILDFGVPQGTSTELLKAFIFCEPQEVDASNALEQGLSALAKFSLGESKIKSAAAAHKSVASRSSRNELFVDVLEDLCVVLDGKGNILSRSIDGQIVMRSFLSGCPNLTVQLNDDLVVGAGGYGSVKFVDVNFHDAVVSQDFARTRAMSLYPPEGEYKVIGYRAETNSPLPLVVLASFGDSERIKHDLYLRVRCELPAGMCCADVELRIPVSSKISSVSTTLGDMSNPGVGSAVYDKITNVVTWKAEKVSAGTEALLRITMMQASEEPLSINVQVPRIIVKFIVPMKAASGVNIQSLSFSDCGKSYNPSKWIRYITNVSSYVVRLA